MLGCTGIETKILEATAHWSKRALKNCDSIRKMFELIEAGKGKHLISVVKPHFEGCFYCQVWAEVNAKEYSKVFKRAKRAGRVD